MNASNESAIELLKVEPAKTVRGILIDPETNAVKQVEYNGNVEHLYQLIGCRCVDLVELKNGDCVFVDDEGLFNATYGFNIEGVTLAGKGLIIGTNEEGQSTHAKHSVQHISATVRMGTLTRR